MSYTFEMLLDKINYLSNNDKSLVVKAYAFAKSAHYHQLRESGEPYITHPINVAGILASFEADANTLAAALLHDVVEDTKTSLEEIREEFGNDIAILVDGVTKLTMMEYKNKEDNKNANLRKIIMSFRSDVRIILIKLADRLHNMRTLQYKDPVKRRRKALETMDLYVPLAYFIGAYDIKTELEDLAFQYLMPQIYYETVALKEEAVYKATPAINEMQAEIERMLTSSQISNEVKIKIKNIYGIHKRILELGSKNDIHDLISLRIIVDEIMECYLALGLIHGLYRPINEEFKDYISNPKTNMYSSIHTTVFGPHSKIIQNQIRTKEMDLIDSAGIGAYFKLSKKDSKNIMQEELKEKYQFYKSLTEIDDTYFDNKDFVSQVNKEILGKKVYVYTATGVSIELPEDSTILDFAYKVDPENADKIVCAYVNEKEENIGYKLKNMDRINIVYSNNLTGPNKEWLDMVHITSAKRKILENLNNN